MTFFENPSDREDEPPENSHHWHEQINKEKKEKTQDLMRFDNLPMSWGQGRELLLNQSIIGFHGYKYWGHYTSLYSKSNHKEKKIKNT